MSKRGKKILTRIWTFVFIIIGVVLLFMLVFKLYFSIFSYDKSTIYSNAVVTRQYTEENNKKTEYYTVLKCLGDTFTIGGYENYCKAKDNTVVQVQINKVSYHGFRDDEYFIIAIM